jgi:hypothetical protein
VSELTDCRTRPSGSPERQAQAPRGAGGTTQPETEEISRARSTVGAARTATRRHRPGPVDVRSAQEGERRLASHPNRRRRGARAENSGGVHQWLPSRGGWRRPVRRADLVGNISEPHRRDPQSTRGPSNGQQGSSFAPEDGLRFRVPPTRSPYSWHDSTDHSPGVDSSAQMGRNRWVVERRLSWLLGCRRLGARYERRAGLLQGLLHLACALICVRVLTAAED